MKKVLTLIAISIFYTTSPICFADSLKNNVKNNVFNFMIPKTIDQAQKIFGKEKNRTVRKVKNEFTDKMDELITLDFGGLKIGALFTRKDIRDTRPIESIAFLLTSITWSSGKFELNNDIKLGTSLDQIKKKFGEPDVGLRVDKRTEETNASYSNAFTVEGNNTVIFRFKKNKLVEITYLPYIG